VEVDNYTIQFVRSWFSRFYRYFKIRVPDIDMREFGVGTWDKKIATRHIAFSDNERLRTYLIEETPLYISYSTAYYEYPANRPMENKHWLGADIVFDLDANLNGNKYPTEEQLEEVKDRAIRLIEEFLIPDFGYSKDELSVNFSGSKGYHIHLKDDRVIPLTADARRQIVDYFQGNMLDINTMIRKQGERVIGPLPDELGWRGRIARFVYNHPEFFYPRKATDEKFVYEWRRTVGKGNWFFVMKSGKVQDIISQVSIRFSDDVDTQVTTDIHRLIRVPNTLHGGSSLCAVRFNVKAIDKFNPLKHAVVFGDKRYFNETVKIKVIEDVPAIVLRDQEFPSRKTGEVIETPLYYGLYLITHKSAVVVR